MARPRRTSASPLAHLRKKAHVDVVRNDINVTPLVDVMLVLLIIFMLMTMVMGRGKDVTLPNAHNFSEEKDKMQPVVSVDNEGHPLRREAQARADQRGSGAPSGTKRRAFAL